MMPGRGLARLENLFDPFVGDKRPEKVGHAAHENGGGLLFPGNVSEPVFVEGGGKSGRVGDRRAAAILERLREGVNLPLRAVDRVELRVGDVDADVPGKPKGLLAGVTIRAPAAAAGDGVPGEIAPINF